MNVQIGADQVLLNLDRNQQAFEKTVSQLSSGLRINSAADDPSGNAIATNLTSKVGGLQQSANNVQNGINALNVANGALVSVQNILTRINNLIVEANSDINSTQDLEDIQAEINQLMTEINTIGEKTNFNGLQLLNGAFDTSEGSQASITEVSSPFGSGSTLVSDYDGNGNQGPLVTNAMIPTTSGYNTPALIVVSIVGSGDSLTDPDSGMVQPGPDVIIRTDVYSSAGANDFGLAPYFQDTSVFGTNQGQQFNIPLVGPNGTSLLMNYTLSNLTQADVGSTIAFLTTGSTGPAGGRQLVINDGGAEGQTLGFSLPTVNTTALGISSISVLQPETVGYIPGSGNIPELQGTSSSNNTVASYSELLVKNALTTITTQEAQIGAQVVAMGIDNTDDNTAILNLTSSASNITDLNVGQATTDYTREQILTSVGTEVLSQIQSNGKIMTALLIQALIA